MPASKQVHVLALARKALSVNQVELAAMINCSPASIQSIELNRLKLSQSLAARIHLATGIDKAWLLENDVARPMPAIKRPEPNYPPALQAKDATIVVLQILFERLFVVAGRQPKTQSRDALAFFIGWCLDILKKNQTDPDLEPALQTGNAFSFFADHPELLDPELKKVINLDFLIKEERRNVESMEKESREFDKEFRALKRKPKLTAEEKAYIAKVEKNLKGVPGWSPRVRRQASAKAPRPARSKRSQTRR